MQTTEDWKEIDKLLLKTLPLNDRMLLMEQLPETEKYPLTSVVRMSAYRMLNQQLGQVVQIMNYPRDKSEWNDSKPLSVMDKLFPFLASSEWKQKQLNSIIFPTDDPNFNIIYTQFSLFKPDYGLRLLKDGTPRDANLHFPNFRISSLTLLGNRQYSTMVNFPIAEEEHALSLDFNQKHLNQILSKATFQIASFIYQEINDDPFTLRTIDFEEEIVFGVRAMLGQIQKVERESFVPLIVQEII